MEARFSDRVGELCLTLHADTAATNKKRIN